MYKEIFDILCAVSFRAYTPSQVDNLTVDVLQPDLQPEPLWRQSTSFKVGQTVLKQVNPLQSGSSSESGHDIDMISNCS